MKTFIYLWLLNTDEKKTLIDYFNLYSSFRLNSDDHCFWGKTGTYKIKTLLSNTQLLLRVTEVCGLAMLNTTQEREPSFPNYITASAVDFYVNLGHPFQNTWFDI